MFAVGSKLADIGGAEPAGDIEFQVKTFGDFVGGAQTARNAVEMPCKVLKTQAAILDKTFSVDIAVVETQAAADIPSAQSLRRCGIRPRIEKRVVGNKELLAKIYRLLPHSVHACRKFPSGSLCRDIPDIVVERV